MTRRNPMRLLNEDEMRRISGGVDDNRQDCDHRAPPEPRPPQRQWWQPGYGAEPDAGPGLDRLRAIHNW